MKGFKGTVRNNLIILEGGINLPDCTEVEVRLKTSSEKRQEAILRLLSNPIKRLIGMDEVICAAKREREECWDSQEGG
jgi:hypothetical protein